MADAGVNSLNSKSLESSDSVQQKTKGVRGAKKTQEDSRRKSVASTIAHQSDLSNFRLPLDEVGDTVFRLRLGHAWVASSRNCFVEVCFPHVISFSSTHHEVLDHRPSGCSGSFLDHFFLEHLLVLATLRRA